MKKATGPANGMGNYRKLLLAKRFELISGFGSQLDTLVGPGSVALEDLVPVFHDQCVALQINRLDFLQLKLIDAALNSPDYGVCVDCGEPIPRRRLDAIPWAVRCIACEERLSSIRDPAQLVELAA